MSESQKGAPKPLNAGKKRTLLELPLLLKNFSLSLAELKNFILSLNHLIIFPHE